jgi:integrase
MSITDSTTPGRRPDAGRRVGTGHEGIYRYVSARDPEHDTYTIKVGAKFAGTYRTLEEARVARARLTDAPVATRLMTVRQFVNDYWEQLYSDNRVDITISNNRYAIKPFVERFGDRRPADIGRMEAKAWAKTAPRNCVRVARAMLNDAADAELLKLGDNPLSKQRLPAPRGRADHTPPTIETVLNMAATARVDFPYWGPVLGSLIEFGFGSCVRPGEAFELKWENIDLDGGYVEVLRNLRRDRTVGQRKMGESTVIALLPLARRALQQVPRRLDSPYVFTTQTGRQLTHSWLQDYWTHLRQYYAGKTNQPLIATLHFYLATRHAGATWLRNVVSVDPADLPYQLGHKTQRTGDRALDERLRLVNLYSHPEVVQALDRIKHAVDRHPLA